MMLLLRPVTMLDAYKIQTAEAVKKANDARNDRITKAKTNLASFDKTLPVKVTQWELDFAAGKVSGPI